MNSNYNIQHLLQQLQMSSPNKVTKRNIAPEISNKSPPKSSNKKSKNKFVDAKGLQAFEVPGRKEYLQRLRKEVINPIQMQNSMLLSKSAPRCMHHNNLITLYCLNQHQPLCVTCMYQNNHHKNHKVIPLNRADKQIEEQLKHYLTSINNSLSNSDDLVNKTHAKLEQNEEQFPQILKKVHEFYNELYQLINQKKKQHVRFIEDVWKKLRYEYKVWSQEYQKVRIFILEKLEQINMRNSDQYSLFNRNLACNLAKIEPILRTDLCPSYHINFLEQLKKFKEVSFVINSKLILTSPFLEYPKKMNQQKLKDQPLSIAKTFNKPHNNKTPIKNKDSFLVTQHINIEDEQKQNMRASLSHQKKSPIAIKEKQKVKEIDANERRRSVSTFRKRKDSKSELKLNNRSYIADNDIFR